MSFIQNLLGSWIGSARRREDLIDLLLMVCVADGDLSERDLDRVARAMQTRDELRGLSWEEVVVRASIIEMEAPSFQETRGRIVAGLSKPDDRRFAVTMAVGLLGDALTEPERDLLNNVCADLDIEPEERDRLLAPWSEADPLTTGYVRCGYNDPAAARKTTVFDAMAHAENDIELALLTFKLCATRALLTYFDDDATLQALGELIEIKQGRFRVDAFVSRGQRNLLGRFLARGEAMHAKELKLLPHLIENTDPSVSVLIGHADGLSPRDEWALAKLDPARVEVIALTL